MSKAPFTSSDWNSLRTAFASSILVDTPLCSLARNLDGLAWADEDEGETAARYIDLEFEEARALLVKSGQSADKLATLAAILSETLAFDAPFGEMLEQSKAAEARENPLLKTLSKLSIPEAFPVTLTVLGPDALEFCRLERLPTLGAFAAFAQEMAEKIVVSGDFRRLLNALSQLDEEVLASLLPYRKGVKGLHLAEALVQAARSATPAARAAEAGVWFAEELTALRAEAAAGGRISRHLAPLGDPAAEALAAPLLKALVRPASSSPVPTAARFPRKEGWGARILRPFGPLLRSFHRHA